MKQNMLLNCDMGEFDGEQSAGDDAKIMPFIDQANIACGFHAGGPFAVQQTLLLAAQHRVQPGAHPAYPDRANFGRRSMALSKNELTAVLHYQIAALEGMAATCGIKLTHVKPHGALYNDAMRNAQVRAIVMDAIANYQQPYPLVLQATPAAAKHRSEAEERGITLWLEAFADRAYTREGLLQARDEKNAVLEADAILSQVAQLLDSGCVTSWDGHIIPVAADTLCVHGDNPEALAAIASIRAMLDRQGQQ